MRTSQEVKYKHVRTGTMKARNLYECLYTYATKDKCKHEVSLEEKMFILDKHVEKITGLENVHVLLKHL